MRKGALTEETSLDAMRTVDVRIAFGMTSANVHGNIISKPEDMRTLGAMI